MPVIGSWWLYNKVSYSCDTSINSREKELHIDLYVLQRILTSNHILFFLPIAIIFCTVELYHTSYKRIHSIDTKIGAEPSCSSPYCDLIH